MGFSFKQRQWAVSFYILRGVGQGMCACSTTVDTIRRQKTKLGDGLEDTAHCSGHVLCHSWLMARKVLIAPSCSQAVFVLFLQGVWRLVRRCDHETV